MKDADRDAALGMMLRRMRTEGALPRRMAAGSLLALRGPLREIDDRLCRIPNDALMTLAHAEAGLASVN